MAVQTLLGSKVYRADIDGLRALAVISVVLFHAKDSWLPGGYIGVDVFFVISGYLITQLVAAELSAGGFSFRSFYLRRFKRLLPAFAVVSTGTLLGALYLMVPADLEYFAGSLGSAWLGLSNIFFAALSGGYFAPRMEVFPLLHTWSLSVEEQFYMAWPVMLWLGVRRSSRAANGLLLLSFIGLIALSHYWAQHDAAVAYYWLPFRAFELLGGAILALRWQELPAISFGWSQILGLGGLGALLLCAVGFDRTTLFPGGAAAAVTLATMAVIYGSSRRGSWSNVLLSAKPMVTIGLLSYSWYLWHWPVLALLRYRQMDLTTAWLVAVLVGTLGLAALTWRFVENPVRRRSFSFSAGLVRLYLLPAGLFIAVSLAALYSQGFPARYPEDIRRLINSYSGEKTLMRDCSYRPDTFKPIDFHKLVSKCRIGAPSDNPPRVLLYGDSHADHLKGAIDHMLEQAGLGGVYHVQGGCSVVSPQTAPSGCALRNEALVHLSENFEFVLLASAWPLQPDDGFADRLRQLVSTILDKGATPIIFKDTPAPRQDMSRCELNRRLGWLPGDQGCQFPRAENDHRQAPVEEILDQLKREFPAMMLVDLQPLICGDEDCATVLDGMALYRDRAHLNARASRRLGERYLEESGNWFLNDSKQDGGSPIQP